MSTGLDLTFDYLASTRNTASIDVLVESFDHGQEDVRTLSIGSLVQRDSEDTYERIMLLWEHLDERERHLVGEASPKLAKYVGTQIRERTDSLWYVVAEMAGQLSMHSALPDLIGKAENAVDPRIRSRSLETVLDLTGAMGRQARQNLDRSKYRMSAVERLVKSIGAIEFHRCEELVDAFLSVVTWPDTSLRALLTSGDESKQLLLSRLKNSANANVIDLLAGWISKPRIPDVVTSVIKTRKDLKFRNRLFDCISESPTRTTCRNLHNLRDLAAIATIVDPIAELEPQHYSAYLHALDRLDYSPTVVRKTAIRLIELCDERAITSACTVLHRLGPLDAAASKAEAVQLAELLRDESNPDRLAQSLLWRQIQLLQFPNADVQRVIQETLAPLKATNFFEQFDGLSVPMVQQYAPVIRLVDNSIQRVIIDDLKHPVMDRRMRAIDIAAAFELIDALRQTLLELYERDHLEVKIKIVESLQYTSSIESRRWLESFTASASGPIRDAAIRAYKNKQGASRVV